MGVKVDFVTSGGGLYRTIVITAVPVLENGDLVVDIDVKADLYSDGKEDWLTTAGLRTHRFPIDATGGEPKPGGAVGSTFFMENDWSIQPYDASHRLRIKGNLYRRDGTTPFLEMPGRTIIVEQEVSAIVEQVEGVGGGGGTGDWDLTEKSQIRLRLGIDGSKGTPASTPDLAQKSDLIAQTSTLQGDIAALPSAAQNAAEVWDEARASHVTTGTFGATSEWAGQVDVNAIAVASADAVWDEARSGHTTPGSFGATSEWASTLTESGIADAVWDEVRAGHSAPGTFGATSEWASTLTVDGIAAGVWDRTRSLSVGAGTFGAISEWTNIAPSTTAVAATVWGTVRGGFPVGTYGAVTEWSLAATATDIAVEVWDLDRAGPVSGSYGAVAEWTGVPPSASLIVDQVWNEARAGHTTPGTFGAVSEWSGTPAEAATMAAAVWEELVASHQTGGTMGAMMQRLLDVMEADCHVMNNGTVIEVRRRGDNTLLFSKTITGGSTIDVALENS